MAMAPKQLIAGPPRTANQYGLFSVVTPTTPSDPHWINGVEWEPLPCRNPGLIADPDCDDSTGTIGLPKNFNKAGPGLDEATSFTVYAPYKCSPVGQTVAEAQAMATEQLMIEEQASVEWALWSNHLESTPTLPEAENATPDGALDPLAALAALEGWFHGHTGTVNGLQGYVHMGVTAATILAEKAALQYRNGQVWTPAGSRVIIGTGYGSGAEDAAGQTITDRIYITPPPFIYRSDIFTSSAREGDLLDRGTNDLYAIAERTYLVGWDSCPTSYYADLEYAFAESGGGGGGDDPVVVPLGIDTPAENQRMLLPAEVAGKGTPGDTVVVKGTSSETETVSSDVAIVGEGGSWTVHLADAGDSDEFVLVEAQSAHGSATVTFQIA